LKACTRAINQAVGDAVSDMLVTLAALQVRVLQLKGLTTLSLLLMTFNLIFIEQFK
jgi:hypothetical protein